jgi:hypothetical protein
VKAVHRVAPSRRAASSSSRGIVSKYPFKFHVLNGMAVVE